MRSKARLGWELALVSAVCCILGMHARAEGGSTCVQSPEEQTKILDDSDQQSVSESLDAGVANDAH